MDIHPSMKNRDKNYNFNDGPIIYNNNNKKKLFKRDL